MAEPRVKGSIANGTHPDRDPTDFYATPPAFTRLLLDTVRIDGPVLEPAAGDGAITDVLVSAGIETESWDILPRRDDVAEANFLTSNIQAGQFDIVTNPPFKLWPDFFERARAVASRHVAFVAPLSIVNSSGRYQRIWKVWRPALIILAPRYQHIRTAKGIVPSQFTHVWVVWDRQHYGPTEFQWGPDVIYSGAEK